MGITTPRPDVGVTRAYSINLPQECSNSFTKNESQHIINPPKRKTKYNEVTPGWVKGFVRSTWCLSTFALPEATIVVMFANPRLGAHSRGHYTETMHASIVRNVGTLADVNRVDLRVGLLILSLCC